MYGVFLFCVSINHMEPIILLETKDFLVLHKPAGLMVHPDGKKHTTTLTDWIISRYPEMKGVGEPARFGDEEIDRPGIVHRLDEETSGVLVVAKTQLFFESLKQQFIDRSIEKEYHAFVWGNMKEDSGIVDVPIGRNKNDFRRRHAGRGIRGEGKPSVTQWYCKARIVDTNNEQFSFLHLFPKTGRTHQLRVHMKYLQRPIVSDRLYAPTKRQALGFNRVALHARKISFTNLEGERVVIEAPYPEDFAQAVAKYVIS